MARKPPSGYETWHDYNVARVERLTEQGFSLSQAYGHARPNEPTVKETQQIEEHFGDSPYEYHIPVDYFDDYGMRYVDSDDLEKGHSYSNWEGPHDLADAQREYDRLGLAENYAHVYYDEDREEWDIWYDEIS